MTERYNIVGWLADDHVLGFELKLCEQVLQILSVTIFFKDRAGDINGFAPGKPQVFGERGGENGGGGAGLHIDGAAALQPPIYNLAAESRKIPEIFILDFHGIDM